jgi:hypothetical protein
MSASAARRPQAKPYWLGFQCSITGLLAAPGALRRLVAGSTRHAAALDGFLALTGAILRVAMRSFGLMRRVFVIARLEVLELSALAYGRHDASDYP